MSAMTSTDKVITEISDKERLMPLASKTSFKEYTPQLITLRLGVLSHWVICFILALTKDALVSMSKTWGGGEPLSYKTEKRNF